MQVDMQAGEARCSREKREGGGNRNPNAEGGRRKAEGRKAGKPHPLTCKEPLLLLPPRRCRQRRSGALLRRQPHRARLGERIQRLEPAQERWLRRRVDRHVGLPARPAHRVQ